MSSPFELRFSCLTLAKSIVENYQSLKNPGASISTQAFGLTVDGDIPESEQFVADVLTTAHKLYLFVNSDFDKLNLPDQYKVSNTTSNTPLVESIKLTGYPFGEEKFIGIEASSIVEKCPISQSQVFRYALELANAGKTVIYVVNDLGDRPKQTVPDTLQFRTVSELKLASADLLVFDSCHIYNDLTLALPIHRFKQVIVYRSFDNNRTMSSDDYFSHFMVNADMKLVGKKR